MDPDHPSYVLGFAFGLVLLISCNILSQNCTAKRESSALAAFFACFIKICTQTHLIGVIIKKQNICNQI